MRLSAKIYKTAFALFSTCALTISLVGAVGAQSTNVSFDEKKALKSFKKCAACHVLEDNGKTKTGPHLANLLNRKAGSVEGYKKYSHSLKKAGENDLNWNAETLSKFLKKPRSFIKGTKMSFAGIKKDEERNNLVAFLLAPKNEPKTQEIELLGASAASLEGDVEYGEYLSGECVTCHQASGADDGIASIVGVPKAEFIHALYEYKTEVRENPVMRTVSKRLGDEEMAALAAFYETLQSN